MDLCKVYISKFLCSRAKFYTNHWSRRKLPISGVDFRSPSRSFSTLGISGRDSCKWGRFVTAQNYTPKFVPNFHFCFWSCIISIHLNLTKDNKWNLRNSYLGQFKTKFQYYCNCPNRKLQSKSIASISNCYYQIKQMLKTNYRGGNTII